jgi:polysaccharide export outer membrane protein
MLKIALKHNRSLLWFCVFASIVLYSSALAQNFDQSQKAREYYQTGNDLYQKGNYKEAQEYYRKSQEILEQAAHEISSAPAPESIQPVAQVPAAQPADTVAPSTAAQPQDGGFEYTLADSDVLQILVWQNPDLTQEVIVRPDGKISCALIGEVAVGGITISALTNILTERYSEYIRNPKVSVSIKKIGGQKVIVLGEVLVPGVYSLTGSRNVLDAIGLAQGFTKDAVASSVVVIHGGLSNPQAVRVNLTKALRGDIRQNLILQPEDIVFVPKKFIANLNYFLSQILDPVSKGMYTASQFKAY